MFYLKAPLLGHVSLHTHPFVSNGRFFFSFHFFLLFLSNISDLNKIKHVIYITTWFKMVYVINIVLKGYNYRLVQEYFTQTKNKQTNKKRYFSGKSMVDDYQN